MQGKIEVLVNLEQIIDVYLQSENYTGDRIRYVSIVY